MSGNGPAVSITAKDKKTGKRKQIAAIWPSQDKEGAFYIKFSFEESEYNLDARKVLAELAKGKDGAYFVDPYVNIGKPSRGRQEDDEL